MARTTPADAPVTTDEAVTIDEAQSTRERILDIAMRLFVEQGFDKTSLREIAEELGFTKAAIYYHFASKEDILLALHMRFHEFGRAALDSLPDGDVTPEQWAKLLDRVIDVMLENRQLFLFQERNQAALGRLHEEHHDAEHEDMEQRIREVLANPALPLRVRVRMASAFGAVLGTVVLTGNVFADTPVEEFRDALQEVVHLLLEPAP